MRGWEADKLFGGVDQGMRVIAPERIPIRLARRQNSVEIGIFTVTEAVQNKQQDRGGVHWCKILADDDFVEFHFSRIRFYGCVVWQDTN